MTVGQAVIMAGGEGSRLRPLTSNVPKPMLPVANRPLMEHIILLLKEQGITDVVATVQFLSSVIRNYFGDGSDLGVSLSYATEEVPLGTAGSVLAARDFLSGTFVVISGDALTDIDLEEAISFHKERGAAATLVLKRMQDPLEFGIVMTNDDGSIERFLEKPTWGQVFSDTINTGIYVLEPEVLDLIPPDQPFDFSSELFPLMLDKGLPLFGHITDSFWTDVGTSEAYIHAQHDVLDGKVKVHLEGFEFRPSVWVGEDVEIDPTARIEGPALIGDNSRIGAGAIIGSHSVIGANSTIGDDAHISRSVLMDRSHVGHYARITGAVLGRGSSLERGAIVEEQAILGDEVVVGAGALIKPRVRIYPSRTVEAGAIVTQSIVRERRATRSLFGSRGVAGAMHIGMTPVVGVRLGMAYGTTLKRGSVVVTGRDSSRAARTMKRAVIAGLNATGITCHDLELVATPLTRFTVRSEQAQGGIGVRTSASDPETLEIRLFGPDGTDITEVAQRKIERIFFREDYRHAAPHKLGELEFPARTLDRYASGLMNAVDVKAIRARTPKVVVDYAFGPYSLVGPSILGRLGCDVLSVHAFTDEARPTIRAETIATFLDDLRDHVRKSGSDLGVLLDPSGEVAYLVDNEGRTVPHDAAFLAFLQHEVNRGAKTVVAPVSSPSAVETIAHGASATLRWTPTGLPALMAAAADPGIGFGGNSEGALIWPEFMPAPDALATFCKALELMAASERALSVVVDALPEVHVAVQDVHTPWDHKGTVMREVASSARDSKLVLLDGVKIVERDRWALVIPLTDQPVCRVWAEAPSAAEAEVLAGRYARMIEDIVNEGSPIDL